MRRDHAGIALLERHQMLSLEKDRSHPGHRIAAANKQKMRDRLTGLITAVGIGDAARLADAVFLLTDGAYASSQTLGGRNGPAKVVAWAANALIDAQLRADAN
jgi:hypothetical protein